MARTQQPPLNQVSQGAAKSKFLMIRGSRSTWIFTTDGVPTAGTSGDGAGWAGKGSLVIDTTNGVLYINTGTKASPTWTVAGSQS